MWHMKPSAISHTLTVHFIRNLCPCMRLSSQPAMSQQHSVRERKKKRHADRDQKLQIMFTSDIKTKETFIVAWLR